MAGGEQGMTRKLGRTGMKITGMKAGLLACTEFTGRIRNHDATLGQIYPVWASHLQADVEAEPYMQPRELRLSKDPPAKKVLFSRVKRVMPPAIDMGTAAPQVQGRPRQR